MDPLSPLSKRILRFSGVQPQVLRQLEAERLKKDSHDLFGENLDVFIKRVDQTDHGNDHGIVELVAHQENSKSLPYSSGFLRNLHRKLTGQDIQPIEIVKNNEANNPFTRNKALSADIFERTISDN
ncbi:hypothetical protein [Vampirovibrio sp.]|uniref:hypothetical protein n=1 Tax=Vampirovibrio sp. TaxID=2717857 RepID=UPI00359321E1